MLSCPRCPVAQCVRHRCISGDYVCCSVVFSTLVGVFVFNVMWLELLMTSAISCPLWASVYAVDLQYDEISLIFTAGSVSLCCGCSYVVVFGLSVMLSWYPIWMRLLMWL